MEKAQKDRIRRMCPELKALASDWDWKPNNDETDAQYRRIYFIKRDLTSYYHPALGRLPKPWIFRIDYFGPLKRPEAVYYNTETKMSSVKDPRNSDVALKAEEKLVSGGAKTMGKIVRNHGLDISNWKRAPIQDHDIRNEFEVVHQIGLSDSGEAVGGMNGGIFVVALKGIANRLFVEKRFTKEQLGIGQDEIRMAHRLKHSSLTLFTAGFLIDDRVPTQANPYADGSLYVEFCDRGSLEDIINVYHSAQFSGLEVYVPEAFAWHAFIGLCDGLMYLQSGKSHFTGGGQSNWIPILHRDIKPDNVFLKSRTTLGSDKYFYCVLSDFGLACEDWPAGHPKEDRFQKKSCLLGTSAYLAPELLHDPYPYPDPKAPFFPAGHKHTKYSDLWAVACTVANICAASTAAVLPPHINRVTNENGGQFVNVNATAGRKRVLDVPNHYSQELRTAVHTAGVWDISARPDPVSFMTMLIQLAKESGRAAQYEPLPVWATRIHEYHSKAEQARSNRGAPATVFRRGPGHPSYKPPPSTR